MATHKSALKRHRQSLRRTEANRRNRSALRTRIKKLRATVGAKNREGASKLLPDTLAMIDRAIQKGVLHENTAARYKSRLTRLVGSMAEGDG